MKALILNSGMGTRMQELLIDSCKCLVDISDGVTILDAQIQALKNCGITNIYITTGPFADKLKAYVNIRYPHLDITFIHNPRYDCTNYIYSIFLAYNLLCDDDIVLMHGDLVFEQNVLQDIVAADKSVMVIDSTKPLPEKDFKAVVNNRQISQIGVSISSNCYYAQPLYKLLQKDWICWLNAIHHFCSQGKTNVYAEEAFNDVAHSIELFPVDITGRVCIEVDNAEDLTYARDLYSKMPDRLQTVYAGLGSFSNIKDIAAAKKPLVVCGLKTDEITSAIGANAVYFDEFTCNPKFTEVMAGIALFEEEACDFIISIGGGSAIDVAKCISVLRNSEAVEFLDIPRAMHLAVPTTAGTGSDSTCFAVLYKDGEKLSVEHEDVLPDYVILDPSFLHTLPFYHKKSAVLDALCQSIESLWAKGRTAESKAYALSAVYTILEDIDGYLNDDNSACGLGLGLGLGVALRILQAANLSGKAINISKTTAAHAMSYKLSNIFGMAHGHAVALCLPYVWQHLQSRGGVPNELRPKDYEAFIKILRRLDMSYDFSLNDSFADDALIMKLVSSVNAQRLGNHPIAIKENELADMYRDVLKNQMLI